MNVSQIAELYVHVIEPALKVVAFFMVVITVLYIINSLGDSKKKTEMVNNIFNIMIKSTVVVFAGLGKGALFLGKLLLQIFNLLVHTISDFFTSKI